MVLAQYSNYQASIFTLNISIGIDYLAISHAGYISIILDLSYLFYYSTCCTTPFVSSYVSNDIPYLLRDTDAS